MYLLEIEKGNETLGNGAKILNCGEVKKLDMENRKGRFVGARVLGKLKQEYDEEFSKVKMLSLPSDPRFTEVLNGRIRAKFGRQRCFIWPTW